MKKTGAMLFSLALTLAAVAQDFPGFGTVPDEKAPDLSAVVTAENGSELSNMSYTSTAADESVLLAKDGASVRVKGGEFVKAGGDTSNDGQSNFYGLNAAVVAANGAKLDLQDISVKSSADGSNAVFATGEGTSISVKNIKIATTEDSSRGLDATYGGKITAENVAISTQGDHCAAFATDRGEGTIKVRSGTANTAGDGSPVIYSTGDISVDGIAGVATGSEIAVIEGKNSISIANSTLTGSGKQGIMLYQSMSGDANIGTSSLTVKDSTLTSLSDGPFFYITNTQSKIAISDTKLVHGASSVLIRASGNNSERGWGKAGANGGTLAFSAESQTLSGDIVCDSISSIALDFTKVSYTGTINAAGVSTVNLSLDKKSSVTLTGDSYVNELVDANKKLKNIASNGHTLYYNKDASANSYLKGKTISLSGGGKAVGISASSFKEWNSSAEAASSSTGTDSTRPAPPSGGFGGNGNPPSGGFGGNGGNRPSGGFGGNNGGNNSSGNGNGNFPSGGMGQGGAMPSPQSLTGVVKVTSSSAVLVADNGTQYTLRVMEDWGQPPSGNNGGMGGNPPSGGFGGSNGGMGGNPPSGGFGGGNGGMGGNPPSGGFGGSNGGMGGSAGGNPPAKPVSMDELRALSGQRATLSGFVEGTNFTVLSINR